MRLLNTTTLELRNFTNYIPSYAILSHTWEDEEILYDDARFGRKHMMSTKKAGIRKIVDSCEKAAKDDHSYIWIDTCCIDKSSSSELSEAINSMFEWYRLSSVCYTYLADLHQTAEQVSQPGVPDSFRYCRWFTRGWTLQELIAPFEVRFYDAEWNYVGDRISLAPQITEVTGINNDALRREPGLKKDIRTILKSVSISTRMDWAAFRTTTRTEDRAYALMGLFDVNMPLLYGEGFKSFRRLQEEIAKVSGDQSILAWELNAELGPAIRPVPFFAPDPSAFRKRLQLHLDEARDTAMSLTGAGLEIDVLLGKCSLTTPNEDTPLELYFAGLNCYTLGDPLSFAVILLRMIDSRPNTFVRVMAGSRTVFEVGDDCMSHKVDSSKGYDAAGISIMVPDMVVTNIVFDPATAVRKRILIIEENHQERISLPPFRLRLGHGMEDYSLTHDLPSVLSQKQLLSEGLTVDWGLLHLINSDSQGFFVVWVIISQTREAYCSAYSWEEVTGGINPWDAAKRMHTVDSFNNAQKLAEGLGEAFRDRLGDFIPRVNKVRQGAQLIHARLDRLVFMGRDCYHFSVEAEPNPELLQVGSQSTEEGQDGRKQTGTAIKSPPSVGRPPERRIRRSAPCQHISNG